jgi:hypothetical protein
MARNIVRPFGLLGHRYEVTERGLLYQRSAWLCSVIGIMAMLAGVQFPHFQLQSWAIFFAFSLVSGGLVMRVPRHGRRLPD